MCAPCSELPCDRGGDNAAAKSEPEAENEPILKNAKRNFVENTD